MTCSACVRRVERSLQNLPGARSVSVNLATERAEIETDTPFDPHLAIEAVRRMGYDAELDTPETSKLTESHGFNWRLWLSVALSIPIFLLSMVFMDLLPVQGWILLALTTPIQFGSALPLYKSAYTALRNGTANMEVLVLLGTLSAYFYSLALTLQGQHHHLYYETSAIIITLVLVGRHLEARARGQARRAMESLWSLLPSEVLRWNGKDYERAPLSAVQVGDRLRVRTGERIPVDGVVLAGGGWVDESALTGESVPAERYPSQKVLGGSLLVDGMLEIEAQAVGQTTLLAQIAQAVEQAQSQKAPVQRLADRIASIFVPVVVLIALGTLSVWWLITGSFGQALVPAVSVLVIACPCALGLAVPIALMTGTTRAVRAGVLIRNITVLERVRQIDTLVLDKTGTLTLGYPKVQRVVVEGIDKRTALLYAYALERTTRHPLAEAIVEYVEGSGAIEGSGEWGVGSSEGSGQWAVGSGENALTHPSPPSPDASGEGGSQTPLAHSVGEGLGVRANENLTPPAPLSASREGGEASGGSPSPFTERGSGGEVEIPRLRLGMTETTEGEGQGVRADPEAHGRDARATTIQGLEVRATTVPGGGVIGTIEGHTVLIGSARFLQEQGVAIERPRREPVLLAVDGRVVAGFAFTDQPLPELPSVLNALRREGIEIILCSGDQPEAVAEFARSVSIEKWYGGQLPQQKAQLVAQLQSEGHKVAFIGDGINDAPALAQADLSIAVAEGTHLATETADLILMNRDLRTLLTALHLSRAIYSTIRQNLFFAFVYNTLGIPLASMGYLNPIVAAVAMSLSSLSVVGNALRLLRWRAPN